MKRPIKKKYHFNRSARKQKTDTIVEIKEVDAAMKLNKYIAHAGLCSRRKASELIKNGQITVNDQIITLPSYIVQKNDKVCHEGKILEPIEELIYLLLNKPKNVITTLSDEQGRKTILSYIDHITTQRVYPVGRLDRNTTGLLIITNDGELAQKLSHPSFKVKKVYKVTLDKVLTEEDYQAIHNTLMLEDGPAPIDGLEYLDETGIRVGIELHIGRNRIVRRIFQHLGYEVVKLDRVRYGNLTKKNLGMGKCRPLTNEEIIILKHLT